MSSVVLSASALAKTYLSGDRRISVLREVSLVVAKGESVSIRGESGSGKSTLLNLLSGLDAPDAGTIHWARAAPAAGRRAEFLGMVFQSFYLIAHRTVLNSPPFPAIGVGVLAAITVWANTGQLTRR